MGNDPNTPDYRADYTGDGKVGDVGSGSDFGAHLYVLYAAGRVHLPEVATTYDTLATNAHNMQPLMARCAATVPGALDQLLTARDNLQVAFRKTAINIGEAAEALVEIADDYVKTDQAAAESFNDSLDIVATPYEKEQLGKPAPPPPSPPGLDNPHPEIEPSPHGPMPVPGEL